jgi:hypothetical protein
MSKSFEGMSVQSASKPSADEQVAFEKSRTLEDAELLRGGAEYSIDEKGHKRLAPTKDQVLFIHDAGPKIENFDLDGKKFEVERLELGGKTDEQYKADLKKEGFRVHEYAEVILAKVEMARRGQSVDAVILTVADLGFKEHASYEDICRRAEELGLEPAPAEVGPAMCLAKDSQRDVPDFYVAMKAITYNDPHDSLVEMPMIFFVKCEGLNKALDADREFSEKAWLRNTRFAFVLSKKTTPTESKI